MLPGTDKRGGQRPAGEKYMSSSSRGKLLIALFLEITFF